MPVTHTLVPNQVIAINNISGMNVELSELSDGNSGTGMQADPANGTLICGMSDLGTQPTNGSTISVNIKSQEDTKSSIAISVTYDNGSNYIQIADYVILGDNESSFVFASYDSASESGDTDRLNAEQVNQMAFLITISLGIIHDFNVTIDDGTGGRIRIQEGRVLVREGRIRI